MYPNIGTPIQNPQQYFSEHTILSSRNDDVDGLNQAILNNFPGQVQTFHSANIEQNCYILLNI